MVNLSLKRERRCASFLRIEPQVSAAWVICPSPCYYLWRGKVSDARILHRTSNYRPRNPLYVVSFIQIPTLHTRADDFCVPYADPVSASELPDHNVIIDLRRSPLSQGGVACT